ncbi:MAG: M15 family metallopeptidase [Bacteroidia bacterium]|nr:M15 family metallopeptidase [Bacteroidia bacterium]
MNFNEKYRKEVMKVLPVILTFLSLFFLGCSSGSTSGNSVATLESNQDSLSIQPLKQKVKNRPRVSIEKLFLQDSLVDVGLMDSTIKVKLMYATTNNFTKVNLYGNFNKCYYPLAIAKKLVKAQQALKEKNPGYSLLIWDATRPHHIQRMMWDTLKLPFNIKINYLAHPDSISMHNYGAAADLTVLDASGKELDMGTAFDFFGEEAQPRLELKMLAENKITQAQIDNRNILREAMRKGGFWPIPTEWWHFNAANRGYALANMKLIK